MKNVLVNVPFRDVYTGKMYEAGKTYPMSEERVKEVKEVNPNFVTVVGNAEEKPAKEKLAKEEPAKEVVVEGTPGEENSVEKISVEEVPAKATRGKKNK